MEVDTSAKDESGVDAVYNVDENALNEVQSRMAWMKDPKYFKKVIVSPSATMKMLHHAHSGVEKGIKEGGKPVEVMGLMLGRPATGSSKDSSDAQTLIVTDCFPLPIEGAETRVLAEDPEVVNYMISLGETLEQTRKNKFMGWYHSHPFDVEVHSHAFLSSTDVSTQLMWQRHEDQHGNPWLAIVIDPLRTLAKKRPEMGAFRAYPPEHQAPAGETPDGSIVTDDHARIERWGSAWNRYYELEIDYFMSSLGSQIVNVLSEEFLWMRTLSSSALQEHENRDRFSDRIQLLASRLKSAEKQLASKSSRSSRKSEYYLPEKPSENGSEQEVSKIKQASHDLAIEQHKGQSLQLSKKALFNGTFK